MKNSKFAKVIVLTAVISAISLFSLITAGAKVADIDGDSSISVGDVTQIQKVIAGLIAPSETFYEIADVNEDGNVNITDVTYIQKYIAGLLSDEPATEPSSEPVPTEIIYPSTLSLNKTSITLGTGEEFALIAYCDIENYRCSFMSENPSIATVTDNGVISAVGTGTSEIICSTENGLTASCIVTVMPMATSLTLNKSSLTLGTGEQFDLDSTVNSGAAAYYRYYYSDNPEIVSVEKEGGLATAKSSGTATISCVMNNGITAKCVITVKPMATSITLNKSSLTLGTGEQFDLDSTINSGAAAYHRYFYSDNPDIASAEKEGGLVTAKSSGTATISCIMNNGIAAKCVITVKPMATSITLNKSSLTLKVGEKFDLDSSVNSGAAAYYRYFYSDDPYIASVEKGGGLVRAKSLGTTTISCVMNNGIAAKCKVTVSGSAVKCIDISTWQGNDVDFNKVKASGIDYVILRAGYGKETYQKDDTFEINYKKAKEAGMKVGAYWFSYAMTPSEASKEADACLYCIKGKQFDLPVYYDMEYAPAITQLNKTTYTNMASSFCNKIKKSGYKAGVYASASVFGYPLDYDTIADSYSVWNAEWNDNYTVSCDIWQYTDKGKVNGIYGDVDLSYIYNLNIVG